MSRAPRGAMAVSTVVALVGVVMVGVGGWHWWASTSSLTPGEETGRAVAVPPAPPVVDPAPGSPRRLVIPALGVRAPVVPVAPVGSTLVPPRDPMELGWWADGARPGTQRGSALVTGHTVTGGEGALNELETLRRGQRIRVRTDTGVVDYRVARTEIHTKGRLAEDAERLFAQDVPGRLVLVTCEDWDGTRYLSNVVVTAVPA